MSANTRSMSEADRPGMGSFVEHISKMKICTNEDQSVRVRVCVSESECECVCVGVCVVCCV